jgi:hypothetical protein
MLNAWPFGVLWRLMDVKSLGPITLPTVKCGRMIVELLYLWDKWHAAVYLYWNYVIIFRLYFEILEQVLCRYFELMSSNSCATKLARFRKEICSFSPYLFIIYDHLHSSFDVSKICSRSESLNKYLITNLWDSCIVYMRTKVWDTE